MEAGAPDAALVDDQYPAFEVLGAFEVAAVVVEAEGGADDAVGAGSEVPFAPTGVGRGELEFRALGNCDVLQDVDAAFGRGRRCPSC